MNKNRENPLHQRLLEEKLYLFFRNSRYGILFIPSLLVAMLVFVLWEDVNHSGLLLWAFITFSTNLFRFLYGTNCRKHEEDKALKRFVGATITYAICWGAGSVYFISEASFQHQVFLILMLCGIASAMAYMAVIRSFMFIILIILFPPVGWLFLQGEIIYIEVAMLLVYYLVAMLLIAKEQSLHFKDSILIRLENQELIAALEEQKVAAEQANRSKSNFFAAASHDLRQPLHAMEFFLEGMAQDIGEEKRKHLSSRLKQSIEGMQDMFSSLLDMARFDAGITKLEKQIVPVNVLFEIMRLKFEGECERKGLTLRIHPSSQFVETDPTQIERVLSNYLSNAIKYTDQGCVLLGCRKRGENLRFEVWDTGCGIPESEIKHIYEEFHQLNNPERDRSKGVGLGLSIVEHISRLLAAPVSAHSKEGRGSMFSVEVPLGDKERVELTLDKYHSPYVGGYFDDIRVWVIDDDRDILDAMEFLLESWGCIVQSFDSQEQVRDSIGRNEHHPDMIISDLRLRGDKSGIEVISMIRDSLLKQVSAILITGDTAPDRLQMIAESGFQVLHKPVSPELLRETMFETIEVL